MKNAVDQLGVEFNDAEIQLGTSFFQDGRIELDEGGPKFFEARVEHFKRHVFVWVDLDAGNQGATHGCDCPHFEETQKGCEHLWALRMLLNDDANDEEDEDDLDEELETFRPVYLIQASESLRKNCIVLSLHDDSGGRVAVDHRTWTTINDDRDVVAIRKLAQMSGGWKDVRHGGGMYESAGPWLMKTDESKDLLKVLSATERLTWGDFVRAGSIIPLTNEGGIVELAIRIRSTGQVAIEGCVLMADEVKALFDFDLLLPGSTPWLAIGGELFRVRAYGGGAWARTLRTQARIDVPSGNAWQFLDDLAASHPLPRVVVEENEVLPLKPMQPTARAQYTEKGAMGMIKLVVAYGETRVSVATPGDLCISTDRKFQIVRDRDHEGKFLKRLMTLGFEVSSQDVNSFETSTKAGRMALKKLLALGWHIEYRGLPVGQASATRFAIRQGEDWFSLTGKVEVDGHPFALSTLLRNYNPDTPWVQLDAKKAVFLDEESRKKLDRFAGLSSFGSEVDGELRFSSEQALLARLVLGDQEIPGAPALNDVRATLEKKLSQSEEEPLGSFKGTLRPYQKSGLAWLSFLKGSGLGGCLADEMGLGKTVQVLAFLQKQKAKSKAPFLVVAPLSLLGNWAREANQFCPDLSVRHYHGPNRSLEDLSAGEIVLTSYGVLRRDSERLRKTNFDVCVLDEAQAIKNQQSKTRAAAMQLQTKMRVALSGTPLENRIEDLWSLLQFLNPSLFTAGASLQSLTRVAETADPASWRQALRPLLLRRQKEEVATDLPELTEQTLVVSMSERQREIYEGLESSLRTTLLNKDAQTSPSFMLEGLLRLRQAACHPKLLPNIDEGRSGKIEILVDHLEDAFASQRKCLVFSQFVGLLDLVNSTLEERGIKSLRLDGRTKNRQEIVDTFEENDEPCVLLISLKVGGTGLNLTSAEVVFLLDPWWNPAVEAQAIARAHRIGQIRQVHAIRLVSENTIEERILRLQDRKRELADSILEAAPQALDSLTGSDLQALLGG